MSLRTFFTSLLMASMAPMAFIANAATYYKSVDEKGNVEYSQTRPNNAKTDRIKVNIYAPENSSSYKRPSLNTDKKDADKTTDKSEQPTVAKDKPAEEKLSTKQKDKACSSAQSNLATMRSKGRVRQRDEQGNPRYLSSKEKQAQIKKAQNLVNKYCK